MKKVLFVFAVLLTGSFAVQLNAKEYKDNVVNKDNVGVVDARGNCVRSKWDGGPAGCGDSATKDMTKYDDQIKKYKDDEECEMDDEIAKDEYTGPVKKRYTVYFNFDKDNIRKDAAETLDAALEYLGDDKDEAKITIIGHADRVAPSAYNVDLSRRRALSVKSYLAERGVKRTRTVVEAQGESNPVTDCEGDKVDSALIKCLQEDRRAVIEIR